jgi:transcriptional regulator with XRE-family HTH domain
MQEYFQQGLYFHGMSIGNNIRALRKSKGWTQVELAQKLNITQQAITAYERGKKRPPVDKLPDIAELFGVTIEDIIGKKPLTIETNSHHLHKNSRTAKIQELFEKLPPLEQRAILKQVTALIEQQKER